MCVDFLYYYPLQERVAGAGSMSYCAGFNTRRAPAGGPTITMCGPLNDDASFTRELNPTFNDTVGTPDKFGFKPKQCPAPLAPSMEAEPSTPAVEAAAPSPEKEPSPPALSPSPSAAPDAVCFPARSLVQTPRGLVRMRDLRLGDSVLVAVDKFSPVFMFSHKIDDGLFPFVELRTARGAIALSTGHLLYVDGTLRAADTVKPGDLLRLPAGGDESVLSVRAVQETGLYNPQTLHGDIVVDGVVASTYTSAVRPEAAHALLAPIRPAAGLECRVSILEKDESGFVRALRKLAWMLSGGLPAVASV